MLSIIRPATEFFATGQGALLPVFYKALKVL